MSFLHAWAIALGLAGIIPLILHLRRRQTDRRISFPALRYLNRAEDERSKSLVASDLLLLAVRIGLLLALALAAAGPLLGRGGARDHMPTDVALIVDNSASVGRLAGDRPLFETLIERARAALRAARPEDRVWVFPTVGEPVAMGVGAVRAGEALARITRTDGGADLTDVFGRASAALPADGERRREIQLVSDLQASALTPARESSGDGTPLVAYVPPPPAEPNGALADIELTGGTTVSLGVGHGVIVRSFRVGMGAADSTSGGEAALRLEVDGRIAGAARAPWGASTTLRLPELSVGPHEGRIELDPTGARADDLRHFSIRVVPPPVAQFFGPEQSFVRIGIETLAAAGRLGRGSAPSVAVVEGLGGGAPWAGAATIVFVPPADPVDLPAFNQGLSALGIGWQARADRGTGDLGLDEPGMGFSLSGVRVRSRYLLRPVGGGGATDTTLLATEDGEPWLVRSQTGDRVVLLLASPITLEATDLPAHPAIIPFLEALLVHWSHLTTWPPSDFAAGAAVALPGWAESVEGPGGSTASVEGGSLYRPLAAGIYSVRGTDPNGDVREANFAANVPATEIDPTPIPADELEELFPGRPVFTAGPDEGSWEDRVYRSRRGRDAAPWLLALALALVGAELFLATPGSSRRASREIAQPRSDAASGASS